MYKAFKITLNILLTIISIPFCIIGAVLLTPIVFIALLIAIPTATISDIWGLEPLPFDDGAEYAPYEVETKEK